jgi:hypothetical protein
MPASNPSPPQDASGTVRGLVSLVAQSFAGVKTFLASIIIDGAGNYVESRGTVAAFYASGNGAFSALNTARLWSVSAAGAGETAVRLGTFVADGSVNGSTKLLAIGTGLGGTFVEKLYLTKTGFYLVGGVGSNVWKFEERTGGASQQFVWGVGSLAPVALDASSGFLWLHYGLKVFNAAGSIELARIDGNGQLLQWGTDSTGAPGAATINKPTGKSAIAVGASSVVITNSLVTANSVVLFSPHARDATCKELVVVAAAGSFTVSGSANATAALPFSWEVKGML